MGYVYAIRSLTDGTCYFGSTTRSYSRRKIEHIRDLRGGRHRCERLQAAFKTHGELAFDFILLAEVPDDKRLASEQSFIDRYPGCYNSARTAKP